MKTVVPNHNPNVWLMSFWPHETAGEIYSSTEPIMAWFVDCGFDNVAAEPVTCEYQYAINVVRCVYYLDALGQFQYKFPEDCVLDSYGDAVKHATAMLKSMAAAQAARGLTPKTLSV
jgi:hypothetical protein